jgi:hypothetical protein
MIRPLVIALLLTTPAFAGGPAWEDMVAEPEPGARMFGAIGACVNAVATPADVTPILAQAGWERVDEYDGNTSFQTASASMMYADDGGFCMVETTDFNTDTLTAFLAAFDISPSGSDADGCTQFIIEETTATLTSGGNDPVCTSATEATLRFEPTP